MLWHIGNTTVRTAYRLRDALIALQGSNLNGSLTGHEQENAFAALLHNEGVLDAPRVEEGRDASDLGRKWRAALSQLGFITPKITPRTPNGEIDPSLIAVTNDIDGLSGRAFEITPNGYRLIGASIITAQQECYLRSLVSYRIPSVIENRYAVASFSPLRFVLMIFEEIRNRGGNELLSFQEFALFVQTSSPEDGIDRVVTNILDYRDGRERARGNVRAYDRQFYEDIAVSLDRQASTLDDYADLSFRYLKATGLFRSQGRGIGLSSHRYQLASLLCAHQEVELSDTEYLTSLWIGANLPTDDEGASYTVVRDLMSQLQDNGIQTDTLDDGLPLADLENRRHELEARILQLEEERYADNQSGCIDEILAWLQAIPSRGSARLPDGTSVSIPRGEGPVYLEWIIWRAFLAINSLCNAPWESRRFQVDQDFLPVSCAPGGGPDMVFEFPDAIVVVEVTLTSSSRQEAAEGEPVRRHVSQYVADATKPVYGLFIAVNIDSNTAHTFRSGDWYLPDDSKLSLDIVPMTLESFSNLFASGRDRLSDMPNLLLQLLLECRARANQDAPQWKESISLIVERMAGSNGE